MEKDTKIFWIVGLTIAMLVLLPYLHLVPKFVISDSDFMQDETILANLSETTNFSIIASQIVFNDNGTIRTFNTGDIYYKLGGSEDVYGEIPDMEGTNTIYKYRISIVANETPNLLDNNFVSLEQWHIVYTKETQIINETIYQNQTIYQNVTVYQNVTITPSSESICTGLGGVYTNSTCTCPNGVKWYDNSTSRVCGPITTTITETIGPNFWMKYGAAGIIFIIMGLIIIYLIYKRTR